MKAMIIWTSSHQLILCHELLCCSSSFPFVYSAQARLRPLEKEYRIYICSTQFLGESEHDMYFPNFTYSEMF